MTCDACTFDSTAMRERWAWPARKSGILTDHCDLRYFLQHRSAGRWSLCMEILSDQGGRENTHSVRCLEEPRQPDLLTLSGACIYASPKLGRSVTYQHVDEIYNYRQSIEPTSTAMKSRTLLKPYRVQGSDHGQIDRVTIVCSRLAWRASIVPEQYKIAKVPTWCILLRLIPNATWRTKTQFLRAIRRSELRVHSRVFSVAIFIVLAYLLGVLAIPGPRKKQSLKITAKMVPYIK